MSENSKVWHSIKIFCLLLLPLLLLLFLPLHFVRAQEGGAQEGGTQEETETETGVQADTLPYIRDFPGKFNLRLILQDRPIYLQLGQAENRIEYRPNTRPMIGFGGNILDIGLSFSLQLPRNFSMYDDEYGQTRFNNYQLNFFLDHFFIDLRYQNFAGLYMENTAEWEDRFVFDQGPLREDLSLRRGEISAIYIINPDRLSLRVYNNAQKQLRGAGSFTIMSVLDYFWISSDNLIIPMDLRGHFSQDTWQRQAEFTGFSLMPGYSHNFVVEDFYMNLTMAAGPELQYRHYQSSFGAGSGFNIQGRLSVMGAVGYDNDVFFAGMHFLAQRNRYSADGLDILYDTGLLRLSVGRRFQETRWMENIRGWELYQRLMNLF